MTVDVSIIVPFYNVEDYLSDCLNSVLNQTIISWEAILIDDGSFDRSSDIAKEFCLLDSRFKYIRQENSGQGEARRKGIEHANGKYIFFLDSDDLISAKAIEYMVKESNDRNLDITLSDYSRFKIDSDISDEMSGDYLKLLSNYPDSFKRDDISNYHDFYRSIYFTVIWGKLFRAKLLKSLNLPSLVGLSMGEDLMMTKLSMINAHSIGVSRVISIYYRVRPGSMTNLKTIKSLDIFTSYEYMMTLYKSYNLDDNELTLLHVAYFDYFIEHFYKFTPYTSLLTYYLKMAKVLTSYENKHVKMIALKSKNLKKIYLFNGGIFSFYRLFLDCFILNPVKSKIKSVLKI